jgi:acyl-CoA synthetase (AMP-forming)/AMP-acid ligase II
LFEAFQVAATRLPDEEAIVSGEIRITYGELAGLVRRCAEALEQSGVRHGDRIGILSPPRPEVLIVLLACARLGAIYLGLGPRLSRSELEYVLDDAGPAMVFVVREFQGRNYERDVTALGRPDVTELDGQNATELGRHKGFQVCPMALHEDRLSPEFSAFLDSTAAARAAPPGQGAAQPDDGLAIIYTSGTTGPPKGALISHRGILTAVTGVLACLRLSRFHALATLPVDHVAFLTSEAVMVILTGGSVVQLQKFDPGAVLETIQRHRTTVWFAIPTMLQRVVASQRIDSYDLSSLELIWWAGPAPKHVVDTLRSKSRYLGVSYGMTESSGGITVSDPDIDEERLMTTVGRPHENIEVRLRGDEPAHGEMPREILIRGPQLMKGYWNKPLETTEAFVDGWFKTGDLGILRDGYLSIVGREKELIRSGGYNISPTEVENVLAINPGVAYVVVIGVADPEYGEAVHAVWCAHPNAEISDGDLERHVRERLAGYKVPKRFWRWSELPFLANGKLDRREMRNRIQSELNTTGLERQAASDRH